MPLDKKSKSTQLCKGVDKFRNREKGMKVLHECQERAEVC